MNTDLLRADKQKFTLRGEKRYAAMVWMVHRARYLKRHFKTADQAWNYAQKVITRYRKLLAARKETV